MSIENIEDKVLDLVKVPAIDQSKETIQELEKFRKKIADEFFANEEKAGKIIWTCDYKRKMEIYPLLSALHKYFGMKEIKKPFPPNKGGGSRRTITIQDRKDNVSEFLAHMQKQFPTAYQNLNAFEKIQCCAIVWGGP